MHNKIIIIIYNNVQVPAGKPGIFVKDVVAGVVQVSLAPSSGLLSDLFKPATAMVEDPNVASERIANPF